MKKLIISGEFTGLNEYINAERGNRYVAAKIKREETERVYWSCREQRLDLIDKPVKIIFNWYLKNEKKDPDNIRMGSKFICDGLVKAGILFDDTQEWIKGFEDHFYIDKKNPRVEVLLT